jgi:phosphatidylserine/phosphatidylglycerophosphate/cardiolipin synthase-like enzyme
MRASTTKDGLTLRVIAGVNSVILGMDLQENKRKGCLGFSIQRTDLGPQDKPFSKKQQASRWLPNLLRFPSDKSDEKITSERAPLQKFRWGDYTQKPNLLEGLRQALDRGAEVKVVYHHRQKDAKDKTAGENEEAAKEAKLAKVCVQRKANPQSAIMHDKFVVLLKKTGRKFVPQAVWTGSTNWTDGAIYGQLNVGHAVYDPGVAATYEALFQLLHTDPEAAELKKELAKLTPVSLPLPKSHRTWAIFSPQSKLDMIDLYARISSEAKCLMVCAPFELHEKIRKAFLKKPKDTLHYLLLDKEKSLGKPEEVEVQEGDPRNTIGVATTLSSPLHDFQGKLLEGKESFLHAGIHIHSKIILADPFGSDPILATGSANYSKNSTVNNDSNTLVIRGNTAVTDIYATEFMRMFEHYHFRASLAAAQKKAGKKFKSEPMALKETDAWSDKYYEPGSLEELDRRMFAGTLV